jgi:hypothetical protein
LSYTLSLYPPSSHWNQPLDRTCFNFLFHSLAIVNNGCAGVFIATWLTFFRVYSEELYC